VLRSPVVLPKALAVLPCRIERAIRLLAVQVGSASSWQSYLRTRGRRTVALTPWKPILPSVWPQRCPTRSPAATMRFAGEFLGIVAQHLLDSFNPSRQTKALEGLSTSCKALARLITSANDGVMVVLVIQCGRLAMSLYCWTKPR
jgi:hypothetical protein